MADFMVDLFSTLDGFGTGPVGYWGKEGPELVAERGRAFGDPDQTLAFGANTYRLMERFHTESSDSGSSPRRRAAPEGGVARAAPLPRQHPHEPRPPGGRAGRPAGVDGVPRHHRRDGPKPGPGRSAGHRPGARRLPHFRRPRPAAALHPERTLVALVGAWRWFAGDSG